MNSEVQRIYNIETKAPELGHTASCLVSKAKFAFAQFAFENKYPDYCRKCGGAGWTNYDYDPSPAGVGLAPGFMTESEECECWTEPPYYCPLCGAQGTVVSVVLTDDPNKYNDTWECVKCGWNSEEFFDNPTTMIHAPDPDGIEYTCWETRYDNFNCTLSTAFEFPNN